MMYCVVFVCRLQNFLFINILLGQSAEREHRCPRTKSESDRDETPGHELGLFEAQNRSRGEDRRAVRENPAERGSSTCFNFMSVK